MQISRAHRTSKLRYLRLIAVMLAFVGQAGLTSAALTLAKDESSTISHTERSGIDLHHGHNEATCAACAALSLQGTPRAALEHPLPGTASEQVAAHIVADAGVHFLFSSPSRAPPEVL
jgi:hypothetical protein